MPRLSSIRVVVLTAVFASLPLVAQPPLRAQIDQLNRQLERTTDPSQLGALLDARADFLVQLMDADPAAVASFALPAAAANQVRRVVRDPALESTGEWNGRLEIAVADDFEHRQSHTLWYLETGSRRLRLHLSATPRFQAGEAVTVKGLAVAGHVAVSAIDAGAITPAAGTPLQCSTLGPQNTAVLMLTMPSNPTMPPAYTAAALQQTFFGNPSDTNATASLNGLWKEMSYGKTNATGQVFGPFALSKNYTCDQSDQIQTEAINLADSTVDFSQYTHVALFFAIGGCSSYVGLDTIGCSTIQSPSKGTLNASVGWFPATPGTSPSSALVAHELGHGLGLGHSSSDAYSGIPLGALNVAGSLVEYGDVFSLMGYPNNGSGYQAGQYPAQHKSRLNWLTPSETVEVSTPGSFLLRPLEGQANPRGLRVLRDPASSAWLWLEYRQPQGDIDTLLQYLSGTNVYNGAVVHYEDPTLDTTHSYLLDFTPGTFGGFNDAVLAAGSSWSDPNSLLTLSAGNATSSGLNVTVAYDQPCASMQYSSTSFTSSGGTGTITVTASLSCSWAASTPVSWIHFTGVSSGQGNGTIAFSIDGNFASAERIGYITVQRQSTAMVETGTGLAVVSVTPALGSGDTGQFTFKLHGNNGFNNLLYLQVRFQGATDCSIMAYTNSIALTADPGTSLPTIPYGAPGQTLANSLCSVSSVGSSRVVSGNDLFLTLQVNFFAAFAGSHRISGQTITPFFSNATIPVGTWTVPATQQPAVTIASTAVGAPFSLDNGPVYQAPVTFYFPAGSQHTITWLSTASGATTSRYAFFNWTDASTSNPRIITVPPSDSTYTANITVQYLLTLAVTPAAGGAVAASPTSADGFYDSGTVVTITATPASGFNFSNFTGDLSGGPASKNLTMSGARSVTAHFLCGVTFVGGVPGSVGPAAISGTLAWLSGAGCQPVTSSNASWFVFGTQTVFHGVNLLPYTIAENTGATRSGNFMFSGDSSYSGAVTQLAAGTIQPNVTSVSPSGGNATSQIFTFQAVDAGGYGQLGSLGFLFANGDGLACSIFLITGAGGSLSITSDNSGQQSMPFPGQGTLQNNRCSVNGATTSVSGAGKVLTVNLDVGFKTAFAGAHVISAYAYDSVASVSGATLPLGAWFTAPGGPSLSVNQTADASSVAAGSPMGFTVTVSNSNSPGTGAATGVTLNDPLPAGTGVNWSISPAYSGPGTCSITGPAGSQTLACSVASFAAGASASVHAASATAPAGCKTYSSLATLTADGVAPLQSGASIAVQCSTLSISGPASIPAAAKGVTYFATTITATGGTGIYTWSATGLPPGISIDQASGTISGTPTTLSGSPYTVDVQVSDSNQAVAHQIYTLPVSALSLCDLNQDGSLSVTDVQLLINEALGVAASVHDLNQDGSVTVADVQLAINAALGFGCAARA